jgi:HemY protein
MTKQFWSKFFLTLKLIILFGILFALYQLPGNVFLRWGSYEAEVALSFLSMVGVGLLVVLLVFHRFYLSLKQIPQRWILRRQKKRHKKAQRALFEGFNALSAEDYQEAKDQVQKLERLDTSNPFYLILKTQIAFAHGHMHEAEVFLKQLSVHPELSFLGLRGLITIEEQRSHQPQLHQLLMDALKVNPQSPWILQKLFQWNIRHAQFDQADIILEQLQITHTQPLEVIHRRKALLAWAEADVAYREQDFDVFYDAVHRSLTLAPDLTEATFRLAQYYGESQRLSKALKTLNQGYIAQPNPEYGVILQQVYADLSPIDLYKEGEKMTASHPNHRYTQQILAKLAIDAKLWGQARSHLEKLNKFTITKIYYQLMAHLEALQHPDQPHLAKNWLDQSAQAPQDATWTCVDCAHTYERWSLLCSSCHGIDSIHWDGIQNAKNKSKSPSLLIESYPSDINKFLVK